MATKEQLQAEEKNCVEVADYVQLAKKALDEPKDVDYAFELLEQAYEECKFPTDYILVAEGFALANEIERAKEIYEEAEENAFETSELIAIANSILVYLKDNEKFAELITRALNDTKKLDELLQIIASLIQQNIKNDTFDKALSKVANLCKNFADYKKVLTYLLDKSVEKEFVREVARSVEKWIDGIENTVGFANLIYEIFEDVDWAKGLLEEVETDAKFTKEFIELAKAYRNFGEQDKTKEMLSLAKDFATETDDMLRLVFVVWDLQDDKKTAEELITKALKGLRDKEKVKQLIEFSKNKLNNLQLVDELIEKFVSLASSFADYQQCFDLSLQYSGQPEHTNKIAETILEKITEPKELMSLAEVVKTKLNNLQLSKGFFQKALENSQNLVQIFELIDKSKALFDDEKLIRDLLVKAEQMALQTADYVTIAEKFHLLLSDTIECKRLLQLAEDSVTNAVEMKLVAEKVKTLLPDEIEYIQIIDEKLSKREQFQDKYDEYLKIESNLKFAVDYISLAKRIVEEVNDKHYCRKILVKAEKFIESRPLDLESYAKLCLSILATLNDEAWVVSIFNNVYNNRLRFINELKTFCDYVMKIVKDKEKGRNLVEQYVNNWRKRVVTADDALKYAKVCFDYGIGQEFALQNLEKLLSTEQNFDLILKFIEFFGTNNLSEQYRKGIQKGIDSIADANQAIALFETLRGLGVSTKEMLEIFANVIQKFADFPDLVLLYSSFIDMFGLEIESKVRNLVLRKVKEKEQKLYIDKIFKIKKEKIYW